MSKRVRFFRIGTLTFLGLIFGIILMSSPNFAFGEYGDIGPSLSCLGPFMAEDIPREPKYPTVNFKETSEYEWTAYCYYVLMEDGEYSPHERVYEFRIQYLEIPLSIGGFCSGLEDDQELIDRQVFVSKNKVAMVWNNIGFDPYYVDDAHAFAPTLLSQAESHAAACPGFEPEDQTCAAPDSFVQSVSNVKQQQEDFEAKLTVYNDEVTAYRQGLLDYDALVETCLGGNSEENVNACNDAETKYNELSAELEKLQNQEVELQSARVDIEKQIEDSEADGAKFVEESPSSIEGESECAANYQIAKESLEDAKKDNNDVGFNSLKQLTKKESTTEAGQGVDEKPETFLCLGELLTMDEMKKEYWDIYQEYSFADAGSDGGYPWHEWHDSKRATGLVDCIKSAREIGSLANVSSLFNGLLQSDAHFAVIDTVTGNRLGFDQDGNIEQNLDGFFWVDGEIESVFIINPDSNYSVEVTGITDGEFSLDIENTGESGMSTQFSYSKVSVQDGTFAQFDISPETLTADNIPDMTVNTQGVVSIVEPSNIVEVSIDEPEEEADFVLISPETERIPPWIKNNAGWWAADQIGDSDFLGGVEYLIKEDIMKIPTTSAPAAESSVQGVPPWVKNNAGWWADGLISEDDFILGIQFLVEQGIIRVG